MFTPLADAFEYHHTLQNSEDQYVIDEKAAKYSSKQRSNIVADQQKENRRLASNTQEAFNMALQAEESTHRSHLHTPSDTSSRQSLNHLHLTVDTLAAQVTKMDHTISELTTRLHRLEVKYLQTNTAISHLDTSRTRESKRTSTSALTDYTDHTTPVTYTRPRKSRHAPTNRSPRTITRSRSDSPRYISPPQWESPTHSHPTDDYTATNILPEEIFRWGEKTLKTHEKPFARYCSRIFQVPRAMVEHNRLSTNYTTDWYRFRSKQLFEMVGALPHHLIMVQQATLHDLSIYLRTTPHLELGYYLSRQGDSTTLHKKSYHLPTEDTGDPVNWHKSYKKLFNFLFLLCQTFIITNIIIYNTHKNIFELNQY